MPVELTIVETTLELGQTNVEVVLESASAPGPAGPGVPAGGALNQVLTKDSGTDYDTSWQDPQGASGGAPDDATYLVTTAHGDLSAEVVVGATPGGELGGTWDSPTVDASHSGSTHAAVQAAAEATAAAALSAHLTDTSDAHDASAISSVAAGGLAATDVQAALNELDSEKAAAASAVMDGDAAGGVLGGTYPNPSFASDMATQAELDAHVNDSSAAHAASAISADSTTLVGTGTDVQAVLEELDNGIADHLADTTDAHDASAISVADSGGLFTATEVEAALAELKNTAPGKEIGYAQVVLDATISDTSSPGDLVVSLGALTYENVPHMIEFFCVVDTGATDNSEVFFELFDDTSNIIRIANVMSRVAESQRFTVFAKYRLTPSAGTHTYNVKAVRVNSNGTIKATPAFPPCFLRAVRV